MESYLETIITLALPALEVAKLEALDALPETALWDHKDIVKTRQAVETWSEAEEQYYRRNERPAPKVAQAFRVLGLIERFLAGIEGVEIDRAADERAAERVAQGLPPHDLSLRRARR